MLVNMRFISWTPPWLHFLHHILDITAVWSHGSHDQSDKRWFLLVQVFFFFTNRDITRLKNSQRASQSFPHDLFFWDVSVLHIIIIIKSCFLHYNTVFLFSSIKWYKSFTAAPRWHLVTITGSGCISPCAYVFIVSSQ